MSRNKHPIKEIEEAVSYAESKGWTAVDSKGHAKFKVICPFNDENCRCGKFCQFGVWSTPRSPENHAKQIIRNVDGCIGSKDEAS